MSESVITALVTLAVCMINNLFQQRTVERKHDETINLIEYKLGELSRRVEKHNNVIERTYRLEEVTALQEEKIKVANHRIEDLEKESK